MEKDSLLYRIKEGVSDTCYIWVKEIRSTITDEGVLLFCIIVPLLYPLLYSWIYNNEVVRDVPVAVVDLSHSHASRQFIRYFDASPDTHVAYYCHSLAEAKYLTGKQKVHGTLYFPPNFDTKLYRREQAVVSVYTDMSLMLTYKAIMTAAQGVSSKMNTQIQIAQGGGYTNRDDEINTLPLDFEEVPIFNTPVGYGNAILPGVLMLILQQTLLLGIGLAAGTARENNRYKDLVPISKHYNGIFRIVLGKSLCYFMVYAVMGTYLALAVPHMFGFISLVSVSSILGLLLPYILASIFFGMMLSCLVRYRENVILLVVFTSVPFLFMTGLSWPENNIPGYWKGISYLIPSTFGVRGFLRISSMGAELSDITFEYHALWIQVFIYFIVTCLVYRYQINHTKQHAYDHLQKVKEKITKAKQRKLRENSALPNQEN
ncbi:ABC-2 type transporter [Bacteroidales bacterium KA00344]|nr:ABC-2 type transporter [Bacteroidales bacterium KA00344]